MALIDYNLEKVYTKTLELENLGSRYNGSANRSTALPNSDMT